MGQCAVVLLPLCSDRQEVFDQSPTSRATCPVPRRHSAVLWRGAA